METQRQHEPLPTRPIQHSYAPECGKEPKYDWAAPAASPRNVDSQVRLYSKDISSGAQLQIRLKTGVHRLMARRYLQHHNSNAGTSGATLMNVYSPYTGLFSQIAHLKKHRFTIRYDANELKRKSITNINQSINQASLPESGSRTASSP